MEVSAVKLRNSYQVCYIDTNSIFVKGNSLCILETEHGLDIGRVVKKDNKLNNKDFEIKGKLIRKVTEEDINRLPNIEERIASLRLIITFLDLFILGSSLSILWMRRDCLLTSGQQVHPTKAYNPERRSLSLCRWISKVVNTCLVLKI